MALRETFFKKDAVAFLVHFKTPHYPNIFIFFETRTQYKVNIKK
jgi:hypothetical protein